MYITLLKNCADDDIISHFHDDIQINLMVYNDTSDDEQTLYYQPDLSVTSN